ncbi:CAP domain-containing protein [Kitasatospora sp. NPDC058218]|uniref:CAP domain-containing protein n=1 Tax=Kitasatospora sp. NPDC058218 TaxID=3346385 RepID=UPI0036D8F5B4
MNSEDRTTILPAAGGSGGGRAARRAADRHRGRGRRRRRGIGPVLAVAAAVAGTGVLAALGGAGYVVYGDRDGQRTVALDPQIAAEAGDHNGIQIPGAGGVAPDPLPAPTDSPSAGDPAHAASAAPTPTTSTTAGQGPSAGASTATASGPATASATSAKPTSGATPSTSPKASTGAAASPGRTTAAPASGTAAGGTAAQYAQQVVDLVNAQRAQHGCGPLTADPRLAAAAQGHSEDMAARNYFDHASPEGRHADYRIEATGYRWSSWGENIARGQKDPAAVMDAWMNSPGHRANILNCSFKEIGVGVKTGSGGPWWTQVFASPS